MCIRLTLQPSTPASSTVLPPAQALCPPASCPKQALSEEAYGAVVCAHLREHLVRSAASVFGESILEGALAYSATVPLQFLELVLPPGVSRLTRLLSGGGRWLCGASDCTCTGPWREPPANRKCALILPPHCVVQEAGGAAAREWRARLSYYVYEAVGSLRIADMFDIVVDYPDRQARPRMRLWGGHGAGMSCLPWLTAIMGSASVAAAANAWQLCCMPPTGPPIAHSCTLPTLLHLPCSLPALEDLRECLSRTNLHQRFIQAFGAAIEARLLHPGQLTAWGC